jgi:predicted  nucleic acid-binding Zn-ribbon protein
MSKISKEELESLLESEKKVSAIKHDLGTLDEQKHNLLHALGQVREESNKVKKELEDKYGKININLKDGSYEEIKEDKE